MPAPAGPLAGAVSFTMGALTVTLGCAALFVAKPALRHQVFASLRSPTLRWWMFTGGWNGALHTAFNVLLTARVGTTVFYNLLTGGTLLGSLLQDATGAFGGVRRPTTVLRLLSVLLTFGGTTLCQMPARNAKQAAGKEEGEPRK